MELKLIVIEWTFNTTLLCHLWSVFFTFIDAITQKERCPQPINVLSIAMGGTGQRVECENLRAYETCGEIAYESEKSLESHNV